jgi:hypothetical protein
MNAVLRRTQVHETSVNYQFYITKTTRKTRVAILHLLFGPSMLTKQSCNELVVSECCIAALLRPEYIRFLFFRIGIPSLHKIKPTTPTSPAATPAPHLPTPPVYSGILGFMDDPVSVADSVTFAKGVGYGVTVVVLTTVCVCDIVMVFPMHDDPSISGGISDESGTTVMV